MKGGKPDDSRRVVLASYSLFVRAQDAAKTKVDGFKITGIDKVTAVIGGNKGYSIMDDLAKEGYKTDPVLRTEQNIAKLAGSRLTAVADITDSASKIINQPEYKGRIVQLEPPIVVKPQYVMFSHQFEKDHAALVEKIWASIVEVRESAEYKAEAEAFLKSL